jgi:hypothetical protein
LVSSKSESDLVMLLICSLSIALMGAIIVPLKILQLSRKHYEKEEL